MEEEDNKIDNDGSNSDQKKSQHRSIKKKKFRKPSRLQKQEMIIKEIVEERIEFLMDLAFKIYPDVPELADRYVEHVRNYSSAVKVPIPRKYKRYICHKCKKLMVPGYSCRIRIQSKRKYGSKLIITCLQCGHMIHIQFKQRKKKTEERN